MIRELRRDPFARTTEVRKQEEHGDCAWCGGTNRHGKVYRYGTMADSGRIEWSKVTFCGKGCRDAYGR